MGLYVPMLHCITHTTYSIWVTVIAEVVVLSVCVVLSFVVGVTISIGLRVTCDSLQAQNQNTRYVDCHIPAEKLFKIGQCEVYI